MSSAIVNRIIPFSYVDGPGNRTAIFLQGCNQKCLYCHNPETINVCVDCGSCVEHCPTNAITVVNGKVSYDIRKCVNCDTCIKVCPNLSSPKVRRMEAVDVFNEIRPYLPFIDGVTVSGGECTLYPEFITELFTLVKKEGKTTYIDTNGQTQVTSFHELMEVTDKFMIDIKAVDDQEHMHMTGRSAAMPLHNLKTLADMGKVFEIRTVVVPGLYDSTKTVDIASKIISAYPDIRYKLIRYRPFGVREDMLVAEVPGLSQMNELKEIASANGVKDILIV